MSRVYQVIVILSICLVAVIDSKDETRFVNVVFRHGNRAPESPASEMYPNDPHVNNTFYPVGHGGLTTEGKRREYKLGQVLRERYNDFLGELYVPEDVAARSSDVGRTKMSLQLVLAGLYPPTEIQMWHNDIKWQPIPTSYVPMERDRIFCPHLACPRYLEELNRVLASPEVTNITEQYRPIMKRLTNYTGRQINEVVDMWLMFHGLTAEASMNLTLPEWTTEFFPKGALLDAANLEYQLLSWNNLLKRLNGGVLLKRMINNMRAAANGTSTGARKIHLFSGHELNIAAILNTLGLYKPHVPEYSSAVVVELFRRDGVDYVKILHYLGIPPEFVDEEIPNCGRPCTLEKFIELMREVTLSDAEMECRAQSSTSARPAPLM